MFCEHHGKLWYSGEGKIWLFLTPSSPTSKSVKIVASFRTFLYSVSKSVRIHFCFLWICFKYFPKHLSLNYARLKPADSWSPDQIEWCSGSPGLSLVRAQPCKCFPLYTVPSRILQCSATVPKRGGSNMGTNLLCSCPKWTCFFVYFWTNKKCCSVCLP